VSDATSSVAARVEAVRSRITEAARRAGRDPTSVRLIAATKTQSVAAVRSVLDAGVTDVGENRAQELLAKAPELPGASWHFIGRLQRNKVNQLAPWVRCWHSVDRPELVDALAARVAGARILVEVNVAGETQKGGCAPAETAALVDRARSGGLDPVGLMTVAPLAGDPRSVFAALRVLALRLDLAELSMGMSGDFEDAIAEGATMIRVGTALFGPRAQGDGGPPGRAFH
jgi:pyridoxal phosphate enzyme (YggS family)